MSDLHIETVSIFKLDEQSVIDLIKEEFGGNFDSIVAAEELGNQVWVTSVDPADDFDKESVEEYLKGMSYLYKTSSLMNELCSRGKLPQGDYEIDCTW